jgi:positive regulator of sigma E activity
MNEPLEKGTEVEAGVSEDSSASSARKAKLFWIFTYISTTTATSTSTTYSSKENPIPF